MGNRGGGRKRGVPSRGGGCECSNWGRGGGYRRAVAVAHYKRSESGVKFPSFTM